MHRTRRRSVAAVVALAVLVGAGALALGRGSASRPRVTAKREATPSTQPLHVAYDPPPRHVSPASSSLQDRIDAYWATTNSDPAGWAALGAVPLPPAGASATFPAIRSVERQAPDTYAVAFVDELLDLHFATERRAQLLAWAESESSPDTFPGVPASVAGRALAAYLSAGPSSPLPTARAWAADARSRLTWSVSQLSVLTDPTWTDLLATGWQPSDLRTDMVTVTGNLRESEPGHPPRTRPFSLAVVLGTATYHTGYGAMLVGDWTLGR